MMKTRTKLALVAASLLFACKSTEPERPWRLSGPDVFVALRMERSPFFARAHAEMG